MGQDYIKEDFFLLLIRLLEECFNKDTLYHLLTILFEMSASHLVRKTLTDLQIFSRLSKFYQDAYET